MSALAPMPRELAPASAPARPAGSDARLRQAARGMETLFASMLLRQMHSSAAAAMGAEESSAAGTYREMLDDALAGAIGRSGALGIGETLYRSLASPAVREVKP